MKVLTPIKGTRPSPTLNKEPAREKREVDIEMTNNLQPGLKLVSRENRKTVGDITVENPRMTCREVNVYYGEKQAIKNVSLDIGRNEVVAMIGPSGCGKSTFIRCLNRMNDTIDNCRVTGEIKLDTVDIYDRNIDVVPLEGPGRDGVSKTEPLPQVGLRQHCLWTEDSRFGAEQDRSG